MKMQEFKGTFQNLLTFSWKFGVTLILLFGIPRFILVLQANQTGNYNVISILFVLMWLTPFIILTKNGRKEIGFKKPRTRWLLYSFILGIIIASIIFIIGIGIYEYTISNWFVYISNSYSIPENELQGNGKHIYFLIFALIGMTFSPIGEEIMYRGLIHQCFVSKFGERYASIIDSCAFAIVHLAHFGIIYTVNQWDFLLIPAILWLILMFFSSRIFFWCKIKSNSIYGAIICHAGFNLAMTYFIFYYIL